MLQDAASQEVVERIFHKPRHTAMRAGFIQERGQGPLDNLEQHTVAGIATGVRPARRTGGSIVSCCTRHASCTAIVGPACCGRLFAQLLTTLMDGRRHGTDGRHTATGNSEVVVAHR